MSATFGPDALGGSNLADLGPEQDAKDAAAILDFFATARRHPGTTRPGFSRSLIDQIWQTKRLMALPGGFGYRHVIYRRALPWSPEAIQRERAPERLGRGLILEHVIPISLVLAEVEAATTPEQAIEALRRDLILAIITKEQNAALNAAGLGKTHPDPSHPWLRYAKAGISVVPFPTR